jgi:adenosylhomocysteine nucleosidase
VISSASLSFLVVAISLVGPSLRARDLRFAVLISANTEWKAVKPLYASAQVETSPYGEYFFVSIQHERVLFFQGGWGKTAAAASTQYVIDHFEPARLINLGTCGGVEGRINRFDIVAPEKVVIYDIREAMGDSREAIEHYSTTLTLPANLPVEVVRTTMYSADRDLTPQGLREMEEQYRPAAVDWESGAIAWVAARNHKPLLILRGVSDLVSLSNGEAQGNPALFEQNASKVMENLIHDLPKWIAVRQ